MDIKSLLSNPTPEVQRRSSKDSQTPHSSSASPSTNTYFSKPPPPPIPNGATESNSSTPTAEGRPYVNRVPSTAGMDTLADLASMQHHQQIARTNASGLRNPEIYESRSLTLSSTANTISSARSGHNQSEGKGHNAQSPTVKVFESKMVSREHLQRMNELSNRIAQSPYEFESHLQLINLLHQGFVSHRQASSKSPQEYELLGDLRQARSNLLHLYAVGEQIWIDWLEDEVALAKAIDDKVALLELFNKAISETAGSSRLWSQYGQWMYSTFISLHPERGSSTTPLDWAQEDVEAGKELFGWSTMTNVWDQANKATKWHVNDSHLVWDPYIDVLKDDLRYARTQQKIGFIKTLYMGRLQTPHLTMNETSQLFSTFLTEFDNDSWEETMVNANKKSILAKELVSRRDKFESALSQAVTKQSIEEEWVAMSSYLEWETSQPLKKMNPNLCNSLYERATLRFSTSPELWQEYVLFLYDKMHLGIVDKMDEKPDLTSALERATRHCPWSGTVWSLYLAIAEGSAKQFHEIEDIKHKATSTGLLEVSGMEEVLKVHNAWCGFLKRRAFHEKATDEEMDVAEVGIRSSLESVKQLGETRFGKGYEGDRTYRLERIYIQCLTLSGEIEHAREFWKSLVPLAGDSYNFWLCWYDWEMVCWAKQSGQTQVMTSPTNATSILKQASKRVKLDWPEKIFEKYLSHVEDYESSEDFLLANAAVRRFSKALAARKLKDGEAGQPHFLQAQAAPQQSSEMIIDTNTENSTLPSKRKRDQQDADGESTPKKSKLEGSTNLPTIEDDTDGDLKRDREHTSVVVRHLPLATSDATIRKLFEDCGTIKSIKIFSEDHDSSATSVVEFESREDVLVAQTRDKKLVDGLEVEVSLDAGSTLYVTNFPPAADELYLRQMFEKYGEVMEIRLPSLRYNNKRRFCYVQFKTFDQALQACQLDGKSLEGENLFVKLSNPHKRKERSGAIYEERQLCIRNLNWKTSEEELEEAFLQFGIAEKVRIPRKPDGQSKGYAFIDFKSKGAADAALKMDGQKFKGRKLDVKVAVLDFAKKQQGQASKEGTPSTPPSLVPSVDDKQPAKKKVTYQEIQERTVAVLNVPDTVNSTRIKALAEPFGTVVKVTLRPDHQGATIEFKEVAEAGKAALGLEGHEIAPLRFLRVGTMQELKKERADHRPDATKNDAAKLASSLKPTTVKRPAQTKTKKRSGTTMPIIDNSSKPDAAKGADESKEANGHTDTKSNADFRAMFLKR